MTKQSVAVRAWRQKTKERVVEAMGGSCVVCGYNRCFNALALHHLDPAEKDFALGDARANPRRWPTLVAELRKCVLVCSVCHAEVHAGITEVPVSAPRFNEAFAEYKVMEVQKEPCPVCTKPKPKHMVTCSVACARRRRLKVDWDFIDLEAMLAGRSILSVAEDLGCSDAAVHKRLRKLGLK